MKKERRNVKEVITRMATLAILSAFKSLVPAFNASNPPACLNALEPFITFFPDTSGTP